MAVNEEARYDVYEAFKASHGERVASGLMRLLPESGVATSAEVTALDATIDHRFTAFEAKIDRRFGGIDHRFAEIDHRFAEIDHRFAALDGKIDHEVALLRRDLQGLEERMELRFDLVNERFNTVDGSLKAMEETFARKLEEQFNRVLRWVVPLVLAGMSSAIAAGRIG